MSELNSGKSLYINGTKKDGKLTEREKKEIKKDNPKTKT